MPSGGSLIFISVAEAFFTYMKVGFIGGLILASPWSFIRCGLCGAGSLPHERRYVVPFVSLGSFFFALVFSSPIMLLSHWVQISVGLCHRLHQTPANMKEYLSFSISSCWSSGSFLSSCRACCFWHGSG